MASGRIDLPAGKHPVVLTFDDSTHDQARLGPDGNPTPESALGILEAFEREHPDFTATGTFYVNSTPEPFTDPTVLTWLHANGYEIGAHTWSHADLSKLDTAGVQAEIGKDIAWLQNAVPGLQVTTLAVPFGVHPTDRALTRAGSHDGVPYRLEAVFGVAEISSPSPYSVRFDRFNIPRLDTGLGVRDAQDALARLVADPSLRYTSDGDPSRISFPAALADRLSPDLAGQANPY
jgi:peptidoglycan/xylan/chitin deacetylase (PgdA/CDA1 family)